MKDTDKGLRNLVIYQIFTRNYKEGTFAAVEADLERIKALGVDYIYLLPIQPSGQVHRKGSAGSPYAIKDYRAIDPDQGSMETFTHLCKSAHDIGLKVMIDVVYNHTSPDSWLAENHPEWFYHKADGSLGNRIGDWWDVVDLDYSNMELWDYQIETLKMWAEYVDGFRCDVAPMIPLDFWIRARREVAEICPDCIWLAEAVEPEFILMNRKAGVPTLTDSELYQAFDICYDYDVYHYMAGAMTGENTLSEYINRVNLQEMIYPDNYIKLRCLENHDRPRAAALIPDPAAMENWLAWTYFSKGTAMIYNGQENADTHHPTLFDHDPVNFETGTDLSDLMARLYSIKKDPIFACSCFNAKVIGSSRDVIYAEYEATADSEYAGQKLIGIFSTAGKAQALKLRLADGIYTNELTGKTIDIFEGTFAYDGLPLMIKICD